VEIIEDGLIKKVDCIRIPVPDLNLALKFYKDSLGHKILWRTNNSIGLEMSESETEIVIHTESEQFEVDLKVDSAIKAVERFKKAGGTVIVEPFDIPIGKCVVVKDPWGNKLILLDSTKGIYKTDSSGRVIGLKK
jgi:lactoylglutathione lyase